MINMIIIPLAKGPKIPIPLTINHNFEAQMCQLREKFHLF